MRKLIKWIKSLRYLVINRVILAEYKDGIMTVKYEMGNEEQYEGECTVWHELPYMKRCDTSTEFWLCELWKYNNKWGGSYPNAHKHGR